MLAGRNRRRCFGYMEDDINDIKIVDTWIGEDLNQCKIVDKERDLQLSYSVDFTNLFIVPK